MRRFDNIFDIVFYLALSQLLMLFFYTFHIRLMRIASALDSKIVRALHLATVRGSPCLSAHLAPHVLIQLVKNENTYSVSLLQIKLCNIFCKKQMTLQLIQIC